MEKIWLKRYPEGIPSEINPDTYRSLVDLFADAVHQFHDKQALCSFGSKLTYGEWDKLSRDLAAYFQQQLGLKKGDRVAIMMPNCLQYPIAVFAALRAGLVVVNVNPLYTAAELAHQVSDAGAETIVVIANFAHTVEEALDKTPLKNIIVTELGDLFATPKALLFNFIVRRVKKMVAGYNLPQAIKLRDALSAGSKLVLDPVIIEPSDLAFLQYTGGTTGVAKGAMLTHRNLLANLEQVSAWIGQMLEVGKEVVVTALPLYHIFSLTANCLTFLKFGAYNILITNPRDIPDFIKTIKNSKFSLITGVNTLFNALLNNSKFKEVDFSHLKMALGGGMKVQKSVADRWSELTGQPLFEAYGLTETSPGVTIDPIDLEAYNGKIGLPLPSTDISIRDEAGNELSIGEIGELCVRGPQVMAGYWNKPDETAMVLSSDGWLRTGDIATIDHEGFVEIVDRKKDMILVSGFNVYPNEVEDIIANHPGVLEVGVVGVSDNGSGEVVKAYIVKRDPELGKDSVVRHCRQHLTSYKVPKRIEFVEELPKTSVGKILRRALR